MYLLCWEEDITASLIQQMKTHVAEIAELRALRDPHAYLTNMQTAQKLPYMTRAFKSLTPSRANIGRFTPLRVDLLPSAKRQSNMTETPFYDVRRYRYTPGTSRPQTLPSSAPARTVREQTCSMRLVMDKRHRQSPTEHGWEPAYCVTRRCNQPHGHTNDHII